MAIGNTELIGYIRDFTLNPMGYPIYLFLSELIERSKYTQLGGLYRVINTITNTAVVSVEDFLNSLSPSSVVARFNFNEGYDSSRPHSLYVTVSNLIVKLDSTNSEDQIWLEKYGSSAKYVRFYMNYLTDLDPNIPLKVCDIKLVSNLTQPWEKSNVKI